MKISYTKGRTINTGNFNSVRIDIGAEIECDDADQEASFEKVKAWVNNKLKQESGE